MTFGIDMRSDTVTKPSKAMREAMANAEVGDDVLDGDPTTVRLEKRVSEMLGKERALFFPSGSMANFAAIASQTQPGTEIFVDADAHIVHWEMAGPAVIAGVQICQLRGESPMFTAVDFRKAIRTPADDALEPSLVCIENTHATAGGMITKFDDMQSIVDVAREHDIPVHLDGARLWNASAASGTPLHRFAGIVDTVMVSFSKGLGAPVGAALAGSDEQMRRAHRVRKRLGGGMRQSGIVAAGALYGLENNLQRLHEDHAAALMFAGIVDGAGGARVVPPQTNIVMIDLPANRAQQVAREAEQVGVKLAVWTPSRLRAVTHLDVSISDIDEAAGRLRMLLEHRFSD